VPKTPTGLLGGIFLTSPSPWQHKGPPHTRRTLVAVALILRGVEPAEIIGVRGGRGGEL
jgi:hypothetical protein